jgi:hypothetical protein
LELRPHDPLFRVSVNVSRDDCGDESDSASKSRRRAHVHYRIVLKEVGLPLSKFASTYELVKIVLDAFEGVSTSWYI